MHSGYVRFPIGEITGIAVSDGTLNYPVEAFFANAPRAEVEAGLRRLGFPIDRVPSPYTCLVIETGERRVLVDTGAGALGQMADSVFSDEKTAQVPPDFVGMARQALSPVRDRLTLVDDGDEIVPGIIAIEAFGHTPGHLALAIGSGEETLLHIVDAALHPLHMEHPDWLTVFDSIPDAALAARKRLLDRVAEAGTLVFGYHLPPFPNLGRVLRSGDGWRWEPIEVAGDGFSGDASAAPGT